MSWSSLKAGISAVVRENNNQEITGTNLQNVLITMVNSLGANATYGGIAHPNTSPGTPDGPVFWIASEPGVYANFGNTEIDNTGIFTWDGTSWSFEELDFGGNIEIVDNLITNDSTKALSAKQGKELNDKITELNNTVKASFDDDILVLTSIDLTSAVINVSVLSKSTLIAAPSSTDTATFTISGERITSAITIAVSDSTNFALSQTIINAPSGGTLADTTITITFIAPLGATQGTTYPCNITITYNSVTQATLTLTAVAAERKSQGDTFNVGLLKYVVLTDTTKVSVEQIDLATTTGDVVVPASVNDENGISYAVTKVADNAFKANSANAALTGLQLPEGITEIGTSALYNRTGITSFVIPNSVTILGNACIYGCSNLASLTIGTGVTLIPNYFYSKCGDNRELVIPNNVTKIQNQFTFADTKFNLLDIGSGITSIDCRPVMKTGSVVIIRASSVPTKTGYPFGNNASGQYVAPYLCAATLKVPSAAVTTFQAAAGWGTNDGNGYAMFGGTNQITSI